MCSKEEFYSELEKFSNLLPEKMMLPRRACGAVVTALRQHLVSPGSVPLRSLAAWNINFANSGLRRLTTDSPTSSEVGPEERRRMLNRILYRSRQRGYLELDLLLGQWATDHIDELDDKHLGALTRVLEEENPDLLSWITGQSEAPDDIATNPVFAAIHKLVSEKLAAHSSAETRAQPGQPWVRGWDDNRKQGGPPYGNQ